ncbi:MAG: Hsp70 family protein [Bryobacteraceae bacterium]|nr:Hsp70 family protein [Bryobacteraceae bacterium]
MKLGIDLGTTRIVVAAVDRGNYPVLTFETTEGGTEDWFPPLVAFRGEERIYGWDAYAAQADPEWIVVRSLKRLLEDAGPNTQLEVGGFSFALLDVLRDLLGALKTAIREQSNLPAGKTLELEAMLGVPANANTNQRFLTAEAFRLAGFEVLGMLNEPSAASIEYAFRNTEAAPGKHTLLVYDLGGGTFDASLVEHDDRTHTVLASDGVSTLGGDDFDHMLAELALEAAGLSLYELTQGESFRLVEECRVRKESLHPNSRKLVIDLSTVRDGLAVASVPVSDFYDRAAVYVDETIQLVNDLLEKHGAEVDSLYLTGGGSALPLVARRVKDTFGKKVKRSAYTRSATAIGLAVQADSTAGYVLRDRFTRYFGVWREGDAGSRIVFDALFPKGTPLPAPGEPPLEILRSYTPVHNIGHFRYLESSYVNEHGQPHGDITLWDEIQFPFDPALADRKSLASIPVELCAEAGRQVIEECYRCDAGGAVSVAIRNLTAGYERIFPLGRWSVKTPPLKPQTTKRRTAKKKASA